MDRRNNITAFYIETLILILIFMSVILVLTQVLGASKKHSSDALLKTNSVCIAQNAAEALESSSSKNGFIKLLKENDNITEGSHKGKKVIVARYDTDMKPNRKGDLILYITYRKDKSRNGSFISSDMEVFHNNLKMYNLSCGTYMKGGSR